MAPKLLISLVTLSICVWFSSALPKCPVKDTGIAVYFSDPDDCAAFYECSNGMAKHMVCAPGLYWNDYRHVCVFPQDVNCGNRPTIPATPTEGPKCPVKDTGIAVYFSDPDDCAAFYECSNGMAKHMVCAPGLYWNDYRHVCVFPQDVNCGNRPTIPATPTEGPKCPVKDTGIAVYFSDPDDCAAFYECSNGMAKHMVCAPGLYWNDYRHVCVFPQDVNCGNRPTIPATPTEGPKCPVKDTGIAVYFSDPDDCAAFYECSNGMAKHMVCAPGLYWNDYRHVCVFPQDVNCGNRPTIPATPTEGPKCPVKDTGIAVYFSDPDDCAAFYECSNGMAKHMVCAPGLYWNDYRHVCVFPQDVNCGNRPTIPATPTEGPRPKCPVKDTGVAVYFSDPDDCAAFYECSNGMAKHMVCAPGLYWNDYRHVCVFPQDVNCGNRPNTPATPIEGPRA